MSETKYNSFDILGRVLSHQQITDGQTYSTSYAYNLSGALIEETYPSNRVVKNTLDADGDLSKVQSKKANDTFRIYANSFNYTAAGAVSSVRLGNSKWENTSFNSRLQPTQIGLGSSATSQNLLKLNYDYGTTETGIESGSGLLCCFSTNPKFRVRFILTSKIRHQSGKRNDQLRLRQQFESVAKDRREKRSYELYLRRSQPSKGIESGSGLLCCFSTNPKFRVRFILTSKIRHQSGKRNDQLRLRQQFKLKRQNRRQKCRHKLHLRRSQSSYKSQLHSTCGLAKLSSNAECQLLLRQSPERQRQTYQSNERDWS